MNVLFIYPNISKTFQTCMGIAYLSSYLKKENIHTFLWDNTFDEMHTLRSQINNIKPDFICFTALSPDYQLAVQIAHYIKSITNVPIIIGGPHATFLPLEILNESCFDVVIRGEGEETLLDYIIHQNEKTPGTYVKCDGVIHINPMRRLPDVNTLPWPDHELFEKHFNRQATWDNQAGNYAVFLTARGCPFKCSYCYSKGMQDLHKGQSYTRYRNIDNVIAEVRYTVDRFNLKSLYFIDETLTTNKARILELCEKYKKEINIPWHCETRPNTVDQEMLNAMADAGCQVVMMGIESGSDRIRNGLYNRNLSEKQIINAFHMAKKAGIKTSAFNICGAPTETREEILSTIELNKKCNVDIGKMTIFTVFPGCKLADYCKKNGFFIRDQYPTNYYIDSNLKHDVLSLEELMELRKLYVDSIGGYTGSSKKGEY